MNIKKIKNLFPMFKNNKKIVYLDNAALAFKPKSVINKGIEFYEKYSISTRTADSILGYKMANDLLDVRKKIANFIDSKPNEVIFNSGSTEGLNTIAKMLSNIFNEGEIIFSYYNHSSAIVPFLENFKNKNFKVLYFSAEEEIINAINSQTKIVVIPQITNNFQMKYNFKKIYEKCKKYNVILINDAAQAVVHEKVSLKLSDVIVFSGNKLYGPTGIGALIIKEELLNKLLPQKWGGGQVQDIYDSWNWNPRNTIGKWEPGTANFAGILQLGEAIDFFTNYDLKCIKDHEKEIANYAYDKLLSVNNIKIDSKRGDNIILFNIENIPSQEVAYYLGKRNIYVRAGAFCAYKFKEIKKLTNSYVRVSLAMYNTKKDIDILVEELKKGGNFIEIF
ncbi:aminotransferase class V-fold PLP-dependent enzyme [Metamycoplasma phocicerebrale]|uniref:Aminotransferase class V-fold PLP-dependent enzyme n=1 Tax=Metamycoplasma phocicerebrale TaxID=142649 RepID=A0A3T0TTT4_9BACT|nr:aminotransferase class V-fold PLP-dependent enzyme [Metamycoplasma phocicerebrale]AZZ65468.1 aminotransferase class V-fold PLP-dependent enzyme [Metamycoplasma phocicerebrale]